MRLFIPPNFRHGLTLMYYSTRVDVRVRFAPSPTGFMHIGGLRTALINKLFALKENGKFILRIEDTDRTRYHPEALQDIIHSLQWANLSFDEGPGVGGDFGPYFQSERRELYASVVNRLIDAGLAYPCFCSTTRLELLRNEQRRRLENPRYDNRCRSLTASEVKTHMQQGNPYTVRFKVPDAKVVVKDIVFGTVEFEVQNSDGDFVILKSDGMPVYHLANVVDDHYMKITHVIRGVEWLSSTPKHLLLYSAMDWIPPKFAHLPLLLSSSGGKLSKRSPEFTFLGQVCSLIKAGYLPSSVLTWLASVGTGSSHEASSNKDTHHEPWHPLLQMCDLVSRFSLDRISRQNVTISPDTLRLCGRTHFDRSVAEALSACDRESSNDYYQSPEILIRLRNYLEVNVPGYKPLNNSVVEDLRMATQLHLLEGRVSCLSDLVDAELGFDFLWRSVDPEICYRKIQQSDLRLIPAHLMSRWLLTLANQLEQSSLSSFDRSMIDSCCAESPLDQKSTMRLIRICLIGREVGSPIVDLINLLTPRECSKRLRKVGEMLCNKLIDENIKNDG